jgi:hypothetical protein
MKVRELFCIGFIAVSAQAAVLDFSGLGLPDGAALPQTYGDTADIDVQYATRVGLGNTGLPDLNLYYSAAPWFGPGDVATVNPACGIAACTGEIFLVPSVGLQVTLNSFQLSKRSDLTSTFDTQYGVFDAAYASLASSGGLFSINGLQTFNPGVTSDIGIRLQWGPDATRVGLDAINFTVFPIGAAAVPEPASVILVGLPLLAFLRSTAVRNLERLRTGSAEN